VSKEAIEEWTTIPAGSDAAPPDATPQEPGGSVGFSRYVFERVGESVLTTLVEGPIDGQVRVTVSYEQLKKLRDDGGAPAELRMTSEELGMLVDQLDVVRDATAKYTDIEEALADGYTQSTEEVPNMGAHFVQPWRMLDGKFDPERPEILLYTSDEEGDWTLVGTSFVLPLNVVGPDHPDAFAGPLDNWHVHYELCTGSDFNSRSSTEQECREDGGTWVPVYGWMIHAWVWTDNPLGVFNMWNPNVEPVAPASAVREAVSVGGEFTVPIENFDYGDATVTAGESLTWTNVDGVGHTVTAGFRGRSSGGFDSGYVAPGGSFELKFDEPGRFAYTCTLHSFMSGTVVVTQ
jgi:plastocyanin